MGTLDDELREAVAGRIGWTIGDDDVAVYRPGGGAAEAWVRVQARPDPRRPQGFRAVRTWGARSAHAVTAWSAADAVIWVEGGR